MGLFNAPNGVGSIIPPRSTGSSNAPGVKRLVEYTDSTGVTTGDARTEQWLYNATGGALTKGAFYMANYTGVNSTNPQVIACATSTPTRELCVAMSAIPSASWGWFCVAGYCDALVEGTTDVAVSDFLKLTSGTTATAVIKDGATITAASAAIAHAAQTANSEVLTKCFILGDRVTVA